jgi:hypothetical protein
MLSLKRPGEISRPFFQRKWKMSGPDSCLTVKIVADKVKGNMLGYVEIDAVNFNAEIHVEYVEKPKSEAELKAEADALAEAAETQRLVDEAEAARVAALPVVETVVAPKTEGWGNAPTA